MLCHNCIQVIIIQRPNEIIWGEKYGSYITECKLVPLPPIESIQSNSGITCDQYTPKINLANRITEY